MQSNTITSGGVIASSMEKEVQSNTSLDSDQLMHFKN